jgi:hypothetical protein
MIQTYIFHKKLKNILNLIVLNEYFKSFKISMLLIFNIFFTKIFIILHTILLRYYVC